MRCGPDCPPEHWGGFGIGVSEKRETPGHEGVLAVQPHRAGSFCTITSSNLSRILVGSTIVYDQAAGIPAGMLDSNVVLDAGNGDRAVGRCTLDFSTGLGLCTFSDGTGRFSGFQARVEVSSLGGYDWAWDGTYSFTPRDDR